MNIAVFPGSFDPITLGHKELVKRAVPLFDKIIVAVGVNTQKKIFVFLGNNAWLGWKKFLRMKKKVEIASYNGLTAHFCNKIGAKYLIRGLRNASDFDYEKNHFSVKPYCRKKTGKRFF